MQVELMHPHEKPVGIFSRIPSTGAHLKFRQAQNNGNRPAAARVLGIHKSTFFRQAKQLGIVLPEEDGRHRAE